MDCHASWINSWLVLDCQQLVVNAQSEQWEAHNDFFSRNNQLNWKCSSGVQCSPTIHRTVLLGNELGSPWRLLTAEWGKCFTLVKLEGFFQPGLNPSDCTAQFTSSLKCNTTITGRNTLNFPKEHHISFWTWINCVAPTHCPFHGRYNISVYQTKGHD